MPNPIQDEATSTAQPAPSGWWPHLRTLLISMHLVAILLMALPAPVGARSKSIWQDKTARDELSTYAELLSRMGIQTTTEDLTESMHELVVKTLDLRERVLAPFRPYYKYVGAKQSWRMFTGASLHPHILEIDVDEGTGWRPLYRSRSREFRWRAHQLNHELVRSPVNRFALPRYRSAWRQFSRWVAREVAGELPAATRVRLRLHQTRSRTPKELRQGLPAKGEYVREQIIETARYRSDPP
jgi:hypothetical protein